MSSLFYCIKSGTVGATEFLQDGCNLQTITVWLIYSPVRFYWDVGPGRDGGTDLEDYQWMK